MTQERGRRSPINLIAFAGACVLLLVASSGCSAGQADPGKDQTMNISQAITHHEAVAQSVMDAISAAAPVGDFVPDEGYVESRDPCGDDAQLRQAWTQIQRATAIDPEGDAFWPQSWPAAQAAAVEAGFETATVLDDRQGTHAVEFSDGNGALISLMARPSTSDPAETWTSIAVRTGCHPESPTD